MQQNPKFTPLFKKRVVSSKIRNLSHCNINKRDNKEPQKAHNGTSFKLKKPSQSKYQTESQIERLYANSMSAKVNELHKQIKFLKQERNHDLQLLRNKEFKIMELSDDLQKGQIKYYMLKKKFDQLKRNSLTLGQFKPQINQCYGSGSYDNFDFGQLASKYNSKLKLSLKRDLQTQFYSKNFSPKENRSVNNLLSSNRLINSPKLKTKRTFEVKRIFSILIDSSEKKGLRKINKMKTSQPSQHFRLKQKKISVIRA